LRSRVRKGGPGDATERLEYRFPADGQGMTRCLQNPVQCLKAQALGLHVRALSESTQHCLLCQNVVQHATLYSCLGITWNCHKVARDDFEDVI
jgi:hypothetical protein